MHAAAAAALGLVAFVAAVSCAPIQEEEHGHYYHYPVYTFKYSVNDPHHGDVKEQHETRNGDQVKGSYSLVDSDGKLRKVEYTSDKHNGFQAIVSRGGKVTLHGYGKQDTQGLEQEGGSYGAEGSYGSEHSYGAEGSFGAEGSYGGEGSYNSGAEGSYNSGAEGGHGGYGGFGLESGSDGGKY